MSYSLQTCWGSSPTFTQQTPLHCAWQGLGLLLGSPLLWLLWRFPEAIPLGVLNLVMHPGCSKGSLSEWIHTVCLCPFSFGDRVSLSGRGWPGTLCPLSQLPECWDQSCTGICSLSLLPGPGKKALVVSKLPLGPSFIVPNRTSSWCLLTGDSFDGHLTAPGPLWVLFLFC